MSQPPVLVGVDVAAYVIYPNGVDGFPSQGAAINLLGIYKSITIRLQLKRADVTPSSQLLVEKRLVAVDWTAQLEHQIRSGGPIGIQLLTTGNPNVIVQMVEESGGAYWTLYGGISDNEMKRAREEGLDTISIENVGPVGSTGSSLFYSPSQMSVNEAANLYSINTATARSFTPYSFHG